MRHERDTNCSALWPSFSPARPVVTLRCRTVPVDLRNLIPIYRCYGLYLRAEEAGNVSTTFKMFIFLSCCSGSSDLDQLVAAPPNRLFVIRPSIVVVSSIPFLRHLEVTSMAFEFCKKARVGGLITFEPRD